MRDSNPTSGSGTFASLIGDIASQVEHMLGDVLKKRGYDPQLAPIYAQMLVGMVASAGQWWLDARKPKLEEMAAHLVNLAWNGLSAAGSQATALGRGARAAYGESARRAGSACRG